MKKVREFFGKLFWKREGVKAVNVEKPLLPDIIEVESFNEVKPLLSPKLDVDVEDENVRRVMEAFDFEKVRSIMCLTKKYGYSVETIEELQKRAKKLLLLCLKHRDREFWWAGGMVHGGLCAFYSEIWGLGLVYIEGHSHVRLKNADDAKEDEPRDKIARYGG